MQFLKKSATPPEKGSPRDSFDGVGPQPRVPAIAVILGAVASIGGFMFGYESGQISGESLVLSPVLRRQLTTRQGFWRCRTTSTDLATMANSLLFVRVPLLVYLRKRLHIR